MKKVHGLSLDEKKTIEFENGVKVVFSNGVFFYDKQIQSEGWFILYASGHPWNQVPTTKEIAVANAKSIAKRTPEKQNLFR